MATGVEVAGLVLAVLPLLVNQLDNYARGLERTRTLRRYSRELYKYAVGLSTQHKLLLNTLEQTLEEVVDNHDERSELIYNPKGPGWRHPDFREKLRKKLGRDYFAFTGTMEVLWETLEDLSDRLGLGTNDFTAAHQPNVFTAIKFRKIFSRAIYDDMLNDLMKSNQTLKTLNEQVQHRERNQHRPFQHKRHLKTLNTSREHAKFLHNVLITGDRCWKCPCRTEHSVCLQLSTKLIFDDEADLTRFHLLLPSKSKESSSYPLDLWHEVEVQVLNCTDQTIPVIAASEQTEDETSSNPKPRVGPASDTPTMCVESPNNRTLGHHTQPITDICSTLANMDPIHIQTLDACIGYLTLEPTASTQYNMRLLETLNHGLEFHSLQEILTGPTFLSPSHQTLGPLCRRDRLYLAVTIASSVLRLHGSWLDQEWETKDILLARRKQETTAEIERPYISWQVNHLNSVCRHIESACDNENLHPMQTDVLYPLGLTLIELSFGKYIPSLHDPSGRFQDVQHLLQRVYFESGSSYGDVVKECLFWSDWKRKHFEDPEFQEFTLKAVLYPLLQDFEFFTGQRGFR